MSQKRAKENTFAEDVRKGLSSNPKRLSSKYFYDDEGSRLFVEIMKLPEYYLTRSETEIFTEQTAEICSAFGSPDEEFDLVELGAGDGTKTAILIQHLLNNGYKFRFNPIDISREALNFLEANFAERFPDLEFRAAEGDYFEEIAELNQNDERKKVLMFLGSNVGNFRGRSAVRFYKGLREVMSQDDLVFSGFDLHKNPKTIINAYDDANGITARFNLNLLKRINRELDADFNVDEFLHYASYHPLEKAARSFLISQTDQNVTIGKLNETYEFKAWEPIYMEISQKFDPESINSIAEESGFRVVRNFYDSNRFYLDSLWKPE